MDIVNYLETQSKRAGSQRAFAKEIGVSVQYLNDVLMGRKEPGDKILAPLGLERVITYRRKKPAQR